MNGSLDRRSFLALGAGAVAAASVPKARGAGLPAVEEVPLSELAAGLAAGRWSSEGLVKAYLERIRALDQAGPRLRSVIELNPEALSLARALDAERRAGRVRGPLHGIPVLLKDNLDTADRMRTTAGSLALLEAPAPREDAHLVGRLREAGALVLGKTNLSEWANFRSTRSVSGWSARGGQTRNPHALDRSPSGSSSGSAVAVAASLCAAAVGTETDGSIVSPAACCGIVGLKPTLGLLSRRGIIPISASQDTAGPMARTVTDAAMLLGALAGTDAGDAATAEADARRARDYATGLGAGALEGARLGWVKNLLGQHPKVDRVMAGVRRILEARGAVLVDVELTSAPYDGAELEVLLFEFKAGLEAYLGGRGGAVRTLADLAAFDEAHAAAEMPFFDQELVLQAKAKGPLTDPAYLKALEACGRARKDIQALLDEHRLGALVGPTGAPAWLIDPVNGDAPGFSFSSPAAVGGCPHLTVPAGFALGLPVGLSFVGRPWSEPALLGLGFAFEQAARARRAPRYRATATG